MSTSILPYFDLDRTFKMRHLVFWILILSMPNALNAQNVSGQDSNFNKIFYEAATTLSATDMNRALFVADSLFEKSETNLQKIKSLMLLATLKERKGDISNALISAMKAEKIATLDKNENWQIRISGFLSTTFRKVGLNEEGIKYLEIAEEANTKIKSPTIESFLNQERAYYFIDAEKYKQAIEQLQVANDLFDKIPEKSRDNIFLATTYQMLGDCFLELADLNKAYSYYQGSLETLNDSESELKGYNYMGLGDIEMRRKNYDTAFKYFTMAESYANKSDNFDLKLGSYKYLASYYKETGNPTKFNNYSERYLELDKIHTGLTQSISNQLIREFGIESKKNTKNIIVLRGFSIFILLLLTIFIFVNRTRRRKIEKRVLKEIFNSDQPIAPVFDNKSIIINEEINEVHKKNHLMPAEAEERLLKKLNKMEESNFFLNKDISLSALAVKLNTNQKYISYLINSHKEKDFNNYINELRINYIIYKLQNEEVYLNYKIAFLAEESGFSSHSKFTAVFKHVTGHSPSNFIESIRKNTAVQQ